MKKTVLIPSMLDFHFPLLKYAFCSQNYEAVILESKENVTSTGLKYLHNDLCYPVILITGQFITALRSGKYSKEDTLLMIPQAGDACRGSNYIHMIRKALNASGFGDFSIISLNFKDLESGNRFKVNIGMVRRGLAAVMYGDILMILKNQLSAYERNPGEVAEKTYKWTEYLRKGIINGSLLSGKAMRRTFIEISDDFSLIETTDQKKPVIGMVGELYVKYCSLGNADMCKFLKSEKHGVYINGFSWYILYYMDTHLIENRSPAGKVYSGIMKYLSSIQSALAGALWKNGFICCEPFGDFKRNAAPYVNFNCNVADGWLIGAEIVNIYKSAAKRIACVQPFGCMPNHIFGKGIYSSLLRKLDGLMLSSIDFDSGSADVNLVNRMSMLLTK